MMIPAAVVAAWPQANLVDPETRGPANVIVTSILLAVVTLLLGIRIYTRIFITKGFGTDDVLIALAYIPATAMAVAGIYAQFRLGWDKHVWDISLTLATPGLKLSLTAQIMFGIAATLTKLSILTLLFRLATASESRIRWLVLAVGVVIAVDGTIFIFILILQCQPVSEYWTVSFEPQNCLDESAHLLAAGIINTATDFILVILPIPITLKMKLPPRQRIVIAALFGGGLLVSAAGAVRTFFTWRMTTSATYDVTWNGYLVLLVSAVELYVGIICASVPATKPFFRRFIPKLLGTENWMEITEPLAERSKPATNIRSSFSTISTIADRPSDDFPIQSPPPVQDDGPVTLRGLPISSPRLLNLNKPLPKIRITVDRTFSWGELSSRASDSRGTILVGLAEPFSRPTSASTHGRARQADPPVPPLPPMI